MDENKRKRLEAAGWKVGSTEEFLGLTDAESEYIAFKLALSEHLSKRRKSQRLTQKDFAKMIHSSQSRVAKMEAGDPGVSLDLLVKSLFALKASKKEIAEMLTE